MTGIVPSHSQPGSCGNDPGGKYKSGDLVISTLVEAYRDAEGYKSDEIENHRSGENISFIHAVTYS
jgi:hypothetical protein